MDGLDDPVQTHHRHAASTRSKASSVHSKASYHGSLRRTREDRYSSKSVASCFSACP